MPRFKRIFVALLAALTITVFAGESYGKADEGSPLPHFSGKALSGETVDTKALAGKAIIIEFWSIYCSSCIQEMPYIIDLYNTYKDQGLAAISVNLDVLQARRVPRFMKKSMDFEVPYPTIIDDRRRTIANSLGVGILPTTILVDGSGTVTMFHVGFKPGFEKELEEAIKKILPGN
jgi:thiol-disulfide isomerase/thioredoxin